MLNQKAKQPINQTCKRNKVDKQCKYSKCTTKSVSKWCYFVLSRKNVYLKVVML